MVKQRILLVLFAALLLASPASAKYFWQDWSLSYLNGGDYRVPYESSFKGPAFSQTESRSVFTLEHSGETDFGDTFFFFDYLMNSDGDSELYGEIAPRFSIGKALNKDLSNGIIQDYFLSYCMEIENTYYSNNAGNGSDLHFRNHLFGFGINFKIKPLQYFKIDYYLRANGSVDHLTSGHPAYKNQQVTVVWGYPFNIGDEKFVYDGFVDYTTPETDTNGIKHHASTNFTSQLKWNIGKHFKHKNPLYLGIEYVHWSNKFGIDSNSITLPNGKKWDTDERNVNLLLQYHF